MLCPAWVDTRMQPIAIRDVLAYLVGALEKPETRGQSFDIGGPNVLTYRRMMDRVAAIMGKRHVIVTVPVLSPRLSAYWVDLITPVSASLAHSLIEGLKNEMIASNHDVQHVMPISLTPFDPAVRLALHPKPESPRT
jgi:uncharacterized protein YbjT (DUF2867 family)